MFADPDTAAEAALQQDGGFAIQRRCPAGAAEDGISTCLELFLFEKRGKIVIEEIADFAKLDIGGRVGGDNFGIVCVTALLWEYRRDALAPYLLDFG